MNYELRIFRTLALLLVLITAVSCNGDNTPECFRNAGNKTRYEVGVPEFNSLYVSAGVEVVLVQGITHSVVIETGENLREYISANVVDGQLRLENSVSCNWVRDYNTTTITVTTPNLEKIYTATQFTIRSMGTLSFPNLSIQSGIFSETASGTLALDVNCDNLTIEDNQNLHSIITGYVDNLNVNFYAGDARFDGTGLQAQNVQVFHRSSNDIIVNAGQQVIGTLYSTGNLVLLNQPPVVNVEVRYTGRIVYE
ncbi:GIN domain-containing protein [Flavobacterium sp. RHBU_24]|uniref:GIN domain-containing protein n=1 Tax=Flavobacterium sp. RHBU_24 TaxID=3391185 RepID=UPI0039854848